MPALTPTQRLDLRNAMLRIWRFWRSDDMPEAERYVDEAVTAIETLMRHAVED